jgi:xylulokinase
MNAEPILIGADVGTTNIKVVAFDRSGRALEGASSPTPTHFPKPGRAYYDPAARGALVGLSTDMGRGALFRAVLEGLAYDSRNSLEPLLDHSSIDELRAIYAIGGGTQNRLLMRIKATVSNQTITVVGVEEATSLGAAILGGMGAGVYADVPSALEELRYAESHVEPTPGEVSFYEAAFRRVYERIYPSLRGVHHEIEALQR